MVVTAAAGMVDWLPTRAAGGYDATAADGCSSEGQLSGSEDEPAGATEPQQQQVLTPELAAGLVKQVRARACMRCARGGCIIAVRAPFWNSLGRMHRKLLLRLPTKQVGLAHGRLLAFYA